MQIKWRPPGGTVEVTGVPSVQSEIITCTTDPELQLCCRSLAEKRYLFVSDVRSWPSPADVMITWQEKGLMPISFLQVTWTGPAEWQVHEMYPGIQEWDIQPLTGMLDNQPLLWTGLPRSL
jgi:hypothetical protein